MSKREKSKNVILIVLLGITVLMAVVYATLSQAVPINGTATINAIAASEVTPKTATANVDY